MSRNKILIIEDNQLNLELTTDLLEANGFVVSSAQTAEEGLRMARGWSCLRAERQHQRTCPDREEAE